MFSPELFLPQPLGHAPDVTVDQFLHNFNIMYSIQDQRLQFQLQNCHSLILGCLILTGEIHSGVPFQLLLKIPKKLVQAVRFNGFFASLCELDHLGQTQDLGRVLIGVKAATALGATVTETFLQELL